MFEEIEYAWLKKGNTCEGSQEPNPPLWNILKKNDVDVFSVD